MCKGIVDLVISAIRAKSKVDEAVDEKYIDDGRNVLNNLVRL